MKIHAISTGSVKVKNAQRSRKYGGLFRTLIAHEWSEWLPIYAWAIEHADGIILVDTGETAKAGESGYFPRWHPYYNLAVRMSVSKKTEIGPQLIEIGIDPKDVRLVIMTHLHTDHAGGLHHFPKSEVLVADGEYKAAQGFAGKLKGYLPHQWPEWFSPKPITFDPVPYGPFEKSYKVTKDGNVLIVPTPGHTPHHVSVIVKAEGVNYFLAGDTTYNQEMLLKRHPDGVSPNAAKTVRSMEKILELSSSQPVVYLPTHDADSRNRLHNNITLPET